MMYPANPESELRQNPLQKEIFLRDLYGDAGDMAIYSPAPLTPTARR